MPIFPEREKEIRETPEEVTPLTIERKEVVIPTPVQFKSQVKGEKGQPLMQASTAGSTIKITIPKGEPELEKLSKGGVSDSLTWFAAFWLRMIKKAIHFGWQLVGGQ